MAPGSRSLLSALLGVVLAGVLPIGQAGAQYAAGGALGEFDRTAALVRADDLTAHVGGNRPLRRTIAERNRERLISALSAVAIATVAREPGRRAEVLAAAEAAAPEVAPEVRRRILAAYPGDGGPSARPSRGADDRPAYRQRPAAQGAAARTQAWLIGAIAADPAGLEGHVAKALAAAPEARDTLIAGASRAFPGHAARIAAAAGGAPAAESSTAAAPSVAEAPAAVASGPEEIWDPLETLNRFTHSINQAIDAVVLQPAATIYTTFTPDPVILAVRRFFANLHEPVSVANDLLQMSFHDAAVAAGRFGVNTTIGLLGFFDPATGMGLPEHHADFGQTLYSYGSGPGPYVVLPLLGPSTLRDGVGRAVDLFFQPTTYLLARPQSLALTAAKGVSRREALLPQIRELQASSVDYYSSLRSAYYQHRAIELNRGLAPMEISTGTADAMFDEAR